MSRHLSEDELLRLAETGEAHAHLAECDACRSSVGELRGAIAAALEVDVPEPSPLFWDHLSRRVREGIAAAGGPRTEVRDRRVRGGRLPRYGLATALRRFAYVAVVVLLAAAAVWRMETARQRRPEAAPANRAAVRPDDFALDPALDSPESATEDASWRLVTDVASTVDLDTATAEGGFSLQPGAAERAALRLSPDEQRELVKLLQAAAEQPE